MNSSYQRDYVKCSTVCKLKLRVFYILGATPTPPHKHLFWSCIDVLSLELLFDQIIIVPTGPVRLPDSSSVILWALFWCNVIKLWCYFQIYTTITP